MRKRSSSVRAQCHDVDGRGRGGIAALLLTAAAVACLVGPAHAAPGDCLDDCPYDVDQSGLVDYDDAYWVFWFYTYYPSYYYCPFDVNGDGVVGFDDATLVLNAPGACPGECGDGVCNYPERPATCSDCVPPPLVTVMVEPQEVIDQYGQWNVSRSYIVGEYCIDPNRDGVWDASEQVLTRQCVQAVVPEGFDGLVSIDWEEIYPTLLQGPNLNPRWTIVVADMLGIVQMIREERPDVKLGFYGLPLRYLYHEQEEWFRAAMFALDPIWDAVDVLYPSIYDFHAVNPPGYLPTYQGIVKFALELAGDKPVYPFSHHRYHSASDYPFELIDDELFKEHVALMLFDTVFEGKRPAGIVHWGHTGWHWEQSNLLDKEGNYVRTGPQWDGVRATFAAEMLPDETIDEFMIRTHPSIYENLAEMVLMP